MNLNNYQFIGEMLSSPLLVDRLKFPNLLLIITFVCNLWDLMEREIWCGMAAPPHLVLNGSAFLTLLTQEECQRGK
jgi:hypothetical protein